MLLAPVNPGDAEKIRPSLVGELLAVLRTMFDYVVVDTPPHISEHVLTALDASAHHVLLTTPDVPALKNLRVVLDVLDMLSYPAEIRSVVLNRAESKLRLSKEDVERVIRTPVVAQIPASRAVPISVNKGTPITLASPGQALFIIVIGPGGQARHSARVSGWPAVAHTARAAALARVSHSQTRPVESAARVRPPGPKATE
jgi:MinD-like ATPase involved in chromosome partitioning or flagellar assembly